MCDVYFRCVCVYCSVFFLSCSTFLTPFHLFPLFIHPNSFSVLPPSWCVWYTVWQVMYPPPLCFCVYVCVRATVMHVLCSDGKSLLPYIHLRPEHVFNPYASSLCPVLLPSVSHAWCLSPAVSPACSLLISLCLSRCWLRLDTYFIWSFIGPATLIIMVRYTYMKAHSHLT